jgi:hypothetical protein
MIIMGEIKSAIELAMERTNSLHLSREEKEKLKEEEVKSKAQGLCNRFLAGDFHSRELERELISYPPEQRAQVEKSLFHCLTEAIQMDQDNEGIFHGIEILSQASMSLTQKVRGLLKDYQERRRKEYQKIEKILLGKWADLGISGSAVKVKVEGSPEWEEALTRFPLPFRQQLSQIQDELRKTGNRRAV